MRLVLHNKEFRESMFPLRPLYFKVAAVLLLCFSFTKLKALDCSPDSARPGIRTRTVYKYNADFTDSTRVFYEEIDPMNKVLKSEGRVFFSLPLMSSENFELAVANIADQDTIFDRYNTEHVCPVGVMECSSFVMKYDSVAYRPLSIKHYGCRLENNKPVFENFLLDEAFFNYEHSDKGKRIAMKVVDTKGIMTERITRTYDKEGRIICTQWEVPLDGYYYKAFYGIYYNK